MSAVDPDTELAARAFGYPRCIEAYGDGGCGLCLCLAEEGEEREQRQDQEYRV